MHKLVRNSLAVSGASGVAAVVAVVSTAVIVVTYGLKADADAYYAAILLPRLLTIIFHGSVVAVLIPAISRAALGDDETRRERLVNNLLNHSFLIGFIGYGLLLMVAGGVAKVIAPGFDAETWRTCTALFRFAGVGIALTFPCEVLIAYLNSRGAFARPAAAEAIRTGCVAAFILLLSESWGIRAAIWGFSLGYVLQLVFLRAVAYSKGLRFDPILDRRGPEFRRVLSEMRYPLMGTTANFAPMVLQRSLASTVPGAVSAFSVAQQIIGMLFNVTLRSVNVASHPVVSRHAARQETEGVIVTLSRSVKLCALIGSAIFVFTVALNRDAVAIIADLKSFSQANADLLCGLLAILALVLPVNGLIAILRSPHYAFGNPRIPAMHMIAMGAVHVCFQLALFRPFGVKGVAVAQVVWVWISVATIFMILPKDCRGVFTNAAVTLTKTVALAVCVGLGLYYARSHITVEILDVSRLSLLARLFLFACATAALLLVLFRAILFAEYREFYRNPKVTERGKV